MSFQISLTPSKRAAGRFIARVRRSLLAALSEEEAKSGLTQADIARTIGVNRSVIHRELRGHKDITLGRVAELASAMGRKVEISLPPATPATGNMSGEVKTITRGQSANPNSYHLERATL